MRPTDVLDNGLHCEPRKEHSMAELSNKAPDPMDAALGVAIRVRRRELGISQERLAQLCGVSFQQVQKYENGSNRISFSRLVQIARALECRISSLVSVLETAAEATDDLQLLRKLHTPGADDMLNMYERLKPQSRAALVNLMETIANPPEPRRQAAAR